jgi:endoglycosylceramidase
VRTALAALLAGLALAAPAQAATGGPVSSPLHRAGRWLVDDQGRVVVVHGVNVVRKVAPFVRTEFTEADARMLADEGFTAARIGFIWEGVEPRPGVYDDAYVQRVADLDALLGRYGIRTLVDFHQDGWSRQTGGDGAPAWATLGSSADQSFAAFWRDEEGIQSHFVAAWRHVAAVLAGHRNVLGLDPFNEPYPGSDHPPPCSDFSPCPDFERGPLAAFYRRVIAAIRDGGARQVIYPEGIAHSGADTPALPRFDDPQTAYTFHYYCNVTQLDPHEARLGDPAPEATACAPIEQRNIGIFHAYARSLGVPTLLGEFSCNDVQPDNAQVVDLADRAFTSWTIWAYYTAADDPADCPRQGLLVDDKQPGVAKPAKLDVLAEPYAQAIAGTPRSTSFDRSAHRFALSYDAGAAPGATLAPGALTQVFVPARQYPHGYAVTVHGASVASAPGAPWLLLRAEPGAGTVDVAVTPASDGTTRRPLETGVLPLHGCASRRVVTYRAPRGGRIASAMVDGRRIAARGKLLRVSLAGRGPGAVRVRLVLRTGAGRRAVRASVLHPCAPRGR